MGNCNGNCGSCSGCARELVLTREEMAVLQELGQFAFLPVARKLGEDIPHDPENDGIEKTVLLQLLEKKGLVSLDYDQPMKGIDYGTYPLQGSMALTERGQKVLELMEYQGIQEETV